MILLQIKKGVKCLQISKRAASAVHALTAKNKIQTNKQSPKRGSGSKLIYS